MTQAWSEEKIVELMDEAFSEGPQAAVYAKLMTVLQEHPEYRGLWEEYRLLRKGMDALENSEGPSEITVARIRQAARKQVPPPMKVSRGWRILLSQPVVAAATVVMIIGFGIYSHYFMKEQEKKPAPSVAPTLEQEQKPDDHLGGILQKEAPRPPLKTLTPPAADRAEKAMAPKPKVSEPPPAPVQPQGQSGSRSEFMAPTGAARPILKEPVTNTAPEEAPASPSYPTTKTLAPPAVSPAGSGGGARLRGESPQSEAGFKEEAAPAKKVKSLGTADTETSLPPKVQSLIAEARKKMQAKDFQGALDTLLEAQRIQDSPEIRQLIGKCRDEIRLIENP